MKKQHNNTTELVFILDRSGSMAGLEQDTIGGAIRHIGNIHKYARKEDVPEKTIFIITTDGMENASKIFTSKEVKQRIEKQKKKGWELLFIGANIDAVETASNIGISREHAVNYHADRQGTAVVYQAVTEAVCNVRATKQLDENWAQEIEKDYNNRKNSHCQKA